MRPNAAADAMQFFKPIRRRHACNHYRIRLGAYVDDPVTLRPVEPLIAGRFIGDDREITLEKRQQPYA
jgi:hypothetical protein